MSVEHTFDYLQGGLSRTLTCSRKDGLARSYVVVGWLRRAHSAVVDGAWDRAPLGRHPDPHPLPSRGRYTKPARTRPDCLSLAEITGEAFRL